MRIARRWVEIWLLLIGVGCLWKGLHLPPPVGDTLSISGRVHSVTSSPVGVNFSVSTKRFSTTLLDVDGQRLRKEMTPDREVTVEGWTWGGVPSDDRMVVVEASVSGTLVASRSRQLATYWLACVVLIGMGLTLTTVGVRLMRKERSVADVVRENEFREVVEPAKPASHERLVGFGILTAGLAGIFGPIVIGSSVSLPLPIKFILAVLPFAALFATIVGSHRLLFGRPLTVHDTPARRIGFGVGDGVSRAVRCRGDRCGPFRSEMSPDPPKCFRLFARDEER